MRDSKHQVVRLLSCVVCSCVVLAFTLDYTEREEHFYNNIEINGIAFSWLLRLVCDYDRWTFVIPLTGLIIGLWLLYKRPQSLAVFEFLIFIIWLFTIIVVGYWFLAWQLELNSLEGSELILIKGMLPHATQGPN